MLDQQAPCPRCRSVQTVPISWGMPTEEAEHDAAAGRVVLGGCLVGDGDPGTQCRACGHRFGAARS
ncbi:hypothetical protein FSW04_06605 [Baekduia soli]|uniref:Uncharacterized protein n=1 Tax=Baekduia soli TaxID=496014 RepID=A0A5B8U2Y6_9ACTN|nr:hypothetical protein FSW04_06605 [Baekduia soli]